MPANRRIPQSLKPWLRGVNLSRFFTFVRVTGLVLLFLLPMQMRAGADDPHPHAMLHLLLDARDGLLDHHKDADHAADHGGQENGRATHEPDVPTVGASNVAGGAMAMLAAVVVLLVLPAARRRMEWAALSLLVGRLPALEPPPPRILMV